MVSVYLALNLYRGGSARSPRRRAVQLRASADRRLHVLLVGSGISGAATLQNGAATFQAVGRMPPHQLAQATAGVPMLRVMESMPSRVRPGLEVAAHIVRVDAVN